MADCEIDACAGAKKGYAASAAAAGGNAPHSTSRTPGLAAVPLASASLSSPTPPFPSLSGGLRIPPNAQAQLSYLSSLLASRKPGYSMPAPLYTDPAVHEADLALLWRRGWLFAGFSCQIPRAGNYFTYEVGDDSIIVIRGDDAAGEGGEGTAAKAGVARAFFNSCRHRGSRIVAATETTQHIPKRLVCPYHQVRSTSRRTELRALGARLRNDRVRNRPGCCSRSSNELISRVACMCDASVLSVPRLQWSYGRDGALVHAREMDPSFDKAANGLVECHLEEVSGLIFICLAHKDQSPMWEFAPARELIAPQLEPHGLARDAKIAHTSFYSVAANWKLVYENNRECYHCAVSHPEYVKSNYDLHLTYKQNPDGSVERDLGLLPCADSRRG